MIFYLIFGFLLFFLLYFLENKLHVSYLHEVSFVLIYFLFVAGILEEIGVNVHYLYVLMLVVSLVEIFLLYYKDLSSRRNPYAFYRYLFLIFIVFCVNYFFINRLKVVFLTLEELKILVWVLICFYLYFFFKKLFISSRGKGVVSRIRDNYLVIWYVYLKNKYSSFIKTRDRNLLSFIYAVILYEGLRRPLVLRRLDVIMYRLDGLPRRFGIMQIWSRQVIDDTTSVVRGSKRIISLNRTYFKENNLEKRYFQILKKMHYQKRERLEVMSIYQKILLFDGK